MMESSLRAPVGLKDPDFLGKMCFGVAAGESEDIVREVSGYLMAEQKDRDSREKELENKFYSPVLAAADVFLATSCCCNNLMPEDHPSICSEGCLLSRSSYNDIFNFSFTINQNKQCQ